MAFSVRLFHFAAWIAELAPCFATHQAEEMRSMVEEPSNSLQSELDAVPRESEQFAVEVVDRLRSAALANLASDIHLIPGPAEESALSPRRSKRKESSQPRSMTDASLTVLFRIDGVLQSMAMIPSGGVNVVSRLKVISGLLTYRNDVPQEGRINDPDQEIEMRVSTFPTIHGEKAVIRLFFGSGEHHTLNRLGFPEEIISKLQRMLLNTTGLILLCGPAGAGKTTTLYAAMRHILKVSAGMRSMCSLEDPVESVLPGVAQSHVKPDSEMNYQRGLSSLMRQDPEVIMVGEIRDRDTAEIAFQASLTGQLILSSFHAGDTGEAISRLSEMEIEPYILQSGLLAAQAQRLMRRLCECHQNGTATGCAPCRQTGYRGRIVVAEMYEPEQHGLSAALANRSAAHEIHQSAVDLGMVPIVEDGRRAVDEQRTTGEEFMRVFGVKNSNS